MLNIKLYKYEKLLVKSVKIRVQNEMEGAVKQICAQLCLYMCKKASHTPTQLAAAAAAAGTPLAYSI